MLNEIYFVNVQGQLEINFDALEIITSKEVVSDVKYLVGLGATIVNLKKEIHEVKISLVDKSATVLIVITYSVGGKDHIANYYNKYDLMEMLSLLEVGEEE